MKTFITLTIVGLGLLVTTAQAQLYRVPGAHYLEERPYQRLQPSPVPPPVVSPYPDPNQYIPRHPACFSTVRPGPNGAVVRTECY